MESSQNGLGKTRTHRLLAVVLVSMIALFLAVFQEPLGQSIGSSSLSAKSQESFKNLNQRYDMAFVDDLLESQPSPLVAELVQADVIFMPDPSRESHTGLLVQVEEKNESHILLLEPSYDLSEEQLESIAAQYEKTVPEFESVEVDLPISITAEEGASVDLESSLARTTAVVSKNPVRIAVIDSGIDPEHEIFDPELLESGWNTLLNNSKVFDDVGHGTHVSGIIRMKAPNAVIIPYKIVDLRGGRVSNVIKAFDKAIDSKVDIINTSFGVLSPSPSLKLMIDEAEENEILVVSAAGNLNSSSGFYPASYDYSIAVGGVDNYGRKMSKSNFGAWVDVTAYGTSIWSALPHDLYGHKSGTSQATAFVTAAIARLIEEEGSLSVEEVLDALKEDATKVKAGSLAGLPIVK